MKSKNLILGGVLIALGVGSYWFFTKKKTTDATSETPTTSETESSTTENSTATDSTAGKSNIADVPITTPIISAEAIKKEQELLAKQKADAEFLLSEAKAKEMSFKNTLSGKTEKDNLIDAKKISAVISENRRKQSRYKKGKSVRAIQKVIDADIARLLALGYTALPNGEVQPI